MKLVTSSDVATFLVSLQYLVSFFQCATSLVLSSSRVPMAAPTSSCFFPSLEARGKLLLFLRSVRAISATSSSFSLTIGSLPEGVSGGKGGDFE